MEMDEDVREAWEAIQEEKGEEQEETLAQNGGQEMDEDVREAWEAIGGADKGINGDKAVKGKEATADNGVKAVNGVKGEAQPGEEEGKPLSEGDWEEIQSGVLQPSNEIVKVDDPGFLDGLKHGWDGIKGIWDDPTGEDGPLWYLTKNILTGIGNATGKIVGGTAKGFVDLVGMAGAGVARAGETAFNALTNSNWHGVSDTIAGAAQGIDKWIDILWADPFILRGMYDGVAGAKEATGAINSVAEMAAGLGGIGAAGKLAKGAAMMKKGMDAARAAKIAHRATAAGFGLGGYERMAADEGGVARGGKEVGFWEGDNWKQEIAAMAGGIAEGTMFGMFGPLKKSFEGLPQLAEVTKMQAFKTFVQEMVKAGAAMGGAEATKQALMGYAGWLSGKPWMVDSGKTEKLEDGREVPIFTPQTLETAAKSTMSQFLVGSGFHLAGAVNGKIGEAARYRIQENRKAYCPIMDRQARTAAALAADGRTVLSGGRGCEYVDEMLADGAVKFKDGSVWRPGRAYELRMPGSETVVKAGRATITVSDGTILDAETGMLAGYAPSGTTWRSVAAAEYAKLAANRRNDLSDAEARARMWELGGNDAGWYLAKPKDVEKAEENSWNRDAYGELSEEGSAWLGITQMSRTPELAEAARAGMADVVGGRRTLVEVHRDLLAAMEAQAKTMDAVRIAPEGMTEASNRPEGKLRNAGMLLESLERGELPVDKECEVKGLDATGTYQETHELEGEWDQAKAEPIIVWIGKDGQRRCVAGKSRLEAARKAGAKTIDAVYVREEENWSLEDASKLDAVQNLREGKGTAEQIFKGIDALGVRNREDLERYGIMHADMPAVLDALDFANLATEPVKEAVRNGTLDAETAGMIVKTLGVGRTGRNAERLQRIAVEKIAGKMSAEEAAGAMEELRIKSGEWKIENGRLTASEKEIDDAIMAGRVKAVGEVRVASDAVAMETEDGKITTVGEELAGKENGERGTGNGERVIDSNEQRYGGTELDVNGGNVGCARFPNAKVTCETAHEPTVEGGVREVRTVVVEGLTAQEMLAPENRADAIDFMGRVAEAAGEMGFRFRDPEANAAAELLLRGEAAKARAAEMGAAEKGLVDAGQRLVDGLFGKESGIKVREGTAEEAAEVLGEASGRQPLRDEAGEVKGWWDREKGEVVLMKGADIRTVAHEIGWHAVRQWAEKNSPELLSKMNEYAASCPKSLRKLIEKNYKGFTGEALIDEIGAGRFERELGDEFRKLLETRPQVRSWWQKVTDAIRKMLRGFIGKGDGIDLKKMKKMSPEEAMKWLAGQMMEGKGLAERSSASGTGKRASIGGIFTGTAADYANESRQGGKEDGPSLQKIGTGEGSQVYGWGLYGSNVRGVAEMYAKKEMYARDERVWTKKGKSLKDLSRVESDAAQCIRSKGDKEKAIEWLENEIEELQKHGLEKLVRHDRAIQEEIREHGDEYGPKEANLYEQTFFTDRAPGDESHLLKWYEPVSETLQSRLLEAAVEEGKAQKSGKYFFFGANNMFEKGTKQTGEELYLMFRDMLGSPMAASEWLAAHDIDGVKYPVDSYGGKGVKDGDKAGWNYVSFRDDNIRVDHKWTDGVKRFSLAPMDELAKSKVGEWVEGTSVDGIRNAIEKRIEEGLPEKEYRFKKPEDRANLVKAAVKFYKRFARKTVMLSDGRCVYFVPDARSRERGLGNEEAWAEYAIHAVTSSGQKLDGKDYSERLYNATKAQNIWRIENILKAERCEAKIDENPERDAVIFFGRGVDNKIVQVITRLDERGNVYADLSEVTVLNGGKMKKLPPRKPLTEVVRTVANRRQRGGLLTADADSISQRGAEGKGEIRPSIGGVEEAGRAEDRREGAEKALKGLLNGRRRVIEPVNPGASESGEAGSAAGIEYEADVQVPEMSPSEDPSVAHPVAMGVSELSRMYRAITGNMFKVKGKSSTWNKARHGTWKNGKAWLAADVFGIVDKSDLEAIKEDLRKEGKFKHEDPQWAATHTKKQIEEMRDLSEVMLEDRITTLADDRVHGKRPGGNRSAINAMAHEIGRLVCEMPVDAGAPQRLKDMHTLGKGIVDALAKDPELRKEAETAAKWWRGELERVNGERGTEKKGDKELFAEMYGMFLGAPEAMRQRAPQAFAKIRELLSGNETLWKAYRGILEARASEGGQAARVMDDIRKQWDEKAQKELHELEKELERPLGSWWTRAKATFLLDFHSTEAPAMLYIDKAVKEKLKEARSNLKKGIIGKGEYEAILKDVKREVEDFKLATLTKQRGGGEGRLYGLEFVSQVLGDATRDGVKLDDLRTYMKCKRTIELQGRADSAGFTGREAVEVLEKMKADMGEAQYQRIEAAANRFRALREKHVLDNPLIAEAFGQKMIDYWRVNASYVRSERILSAEEVATYKRMREEWLKEHPGETNVLADIEAMMDMHMAHSGGSHGETFMKRLEGSQKMTEDPLRATIENDLRIQEFARRNHYAVQLARAAKELGLGGFAVTKDLRGSLKGSKRYGTVSFLENGERKVLVMPKVVAEGFAAAAKDMNLLIRANRWISGILTQYSPRFALRNIVRNRESNNNNIAWMREGAVVTAAGVAGMRPVARWANFLMEQAAAHLPDKVARNALMNVLYGEKTNMYWVAQATRMAKLMTDPAKLRKRSEEADRLATAGKYTEAQQIKEEIKQIKKFMKMPIFAGMREMVEGKAGKSNLDELLGTLGFDTNADGTELKGLKRLGAKMKRFHESVRRYNTFEEARVKIIALLAAERANMRAAAEGREVRSAKEIAYTVATMSGSPRYENRGRAMNYLEVACGPFMNVGLKGAARTIESMRSDPGAWWSKAAGRIAGRLSTCVLWMGGGYKVLSNAWRAANGDDEEANRAAEALDRFGKRMSHALANCSDYRLRNYDIVPVGLFGKWSTFGISMPRGDEDRLLMPAVDLLAKSLVDSKTAERCGFSKYTDMGYGAGDALYATLPGSGLVPDMGRSGIIWNVFRDAAYAWFQNPYNTFTQRTVYSQKDWDARYIDPWNFAKKVGKQVWRDLGGETVLPASSWDEDEGQWEDQGKWAMGFSDPEDAGAMPVGGKTIFQALHKIPWLSAAASGMLFMANDGNKRIARRIDKLRQADMKAERYVIDKIANEVVRGLAAKGAEWDYSDYVSEQLEKYRLPEDTDREIIEDRVFDKVQKVIDGEELQSDPIGKAVGKMGEDRRFEQIMKHLESIGWKEDE